MSHTCGGNGNRRHFLKATAATGATLISADVLRAQQAAPAQVPVVTLGKTGQKVPKLGMGTSWDVAPSFVQAALFSGVTYIDTSETYENGNAEKVLGEVIERTKKRKDVYLVSKCGRYRKGGEKYDGGAFESALRGSLERLRTDYVDAYYIHGLEGKNIDILKDPAVKATFEKFKKEGKIRYCGLSCHDKMLPEILAMAAEVGWLDQVMFQYNFRFVDHDALQRSIDKAAKANLGLAAMKTQKGAAESLPDKVEAFTAKGFKKEVAAIKSVWLDDRINVVVSEMTNFNELKDNVAASKEPLTPKEARLLEEYRTKTANLYCHGCGHLCESAAKGVPVATVLRYLRYYEAYGKREQARELYQALPPEARVLAESNLRDAEGACPHGLPLVQLVTKADRLLS
jgi:predicted aldo/keto reductase-like oxidoreductase